MLLHALGTLLPTVCVSVFCERFAMTTPCVGKIMCHCVCVCLVEEFCRLWEHRLTTVEDDHQKSDNPCSCRRTSSERAPWKGAHNNLVLELSSDGSLECWSQGVLV